ncbi:septal ring lytic transglycosylase RlpA family protein [Teichococcus vastitatis]|uniref:Endolytic peptidoglycan transglycosylase RlpA n=1 Tax=Teichococcus vastitatis TaxID=2307076 RepID=A0ABS9W272_9PROT|nr:RlpA-like double-psi beta-barrel domain-containing protein [Pseudoroseomonas vastitatis]MCI0753397.1 SPOR domain-containing protein [Pseudoroseomonas vastitatis]
MIPAGALYLAVLGGCMLVCSCAPPGPAAVPAPQYVVGEPYQMGSRWSYPREDFDLRESGLAAVIADRRAGRRTVNGEIYDPDRLTASHRTLQLPAILRVTNLENGLQLLVRVNDRGPAQPGRLLELSRRAAELLQIPPAGGTQIAIAVEGEPSRTLAAALPTQEARSLRIDAAPREQLQAERLPDVPGARTAASVRRAPAGPAVADLPRPSGDENVVLPELPARGPARPGRLMIQAGSFTSRGDAQRQAARIGARVDTVGQGRRAEHRVRLGPFPDAAQADNALEAALRSGVSDARIIID